MQSRNGSVLASEKFWTQPQTPEIPLIQASNLKCCLGIFRRAGESYWASIVLAPRSRQINLPSRRQNILARPCCSGFPFLTNCVTMSSSYVPCSALRDPVFTSERNPCTKTRAQRQESNKGSRKSAISFRSTLRRFVTRRPVDDRYCARDP